MPRDGYINLTLRTSVRNRLARIAKRQNRTMTEQLEDMLDTMERSLGFKSVKPSARASRGSSTPSASKKKRR